MGDIYVPCAAKETLMRNLSTHLIQTVRERIEFKRKISGIMPEGFTDRLRMLISTGLYVGLLPASGTWGSLWVPALYYLFPHAWFPVFVLIAAPVVTVLGAWSSRRCEHLWCKDSGRIVIDEVDGMLVTFLFLPVNSAVIWIGFFLFRAFDIVKPPPVNYAERLGGGWGVMLDDVLAGVYANISLRLILILFPGLAY